MITEIKCINSGKKPGKGWRFITSREVERLLTEDFELFKNLERTGFYEIINEDGLEPVFFDCLNGIFHMNGINFLYDDGRSRGVLICKDERRNNEGKKWDYVGTGSLFCLAFFILFVWWCLNG